ncbi:hypothetical protein JX265_013569 [Neoarthrinium moseri]|uniref:2EXR domain-containing protein n=1 Tax=Neoarthrinium moseri TaxID=1658444 RepID=A0A9P9W8I8_9PEZI|nr:uncharacterized protein JN550_012188 [Neoarthrinium moseri]KAI1847251.1 hypothetical protein JX266_006791 [Neoarthrinium moseri]KAI1849866.1 hypothetical protein JX265_013569 [Neoarthrinium moseri]KAI1859175.1 hypothetical protein JN550_012188 [Neoarthrinium moseri]
MITASDTKGLQQPNVSDGQRFTLFPELPTELRLKIWRLSLTPRVVELHSRRAHYAMSDNAKWHSSCGNPAALSVCWESRDEAWSFYSVALPIGDDDRLERVLYINPACDTVVVLGDLDYRRLLDLFVTIATLDPTRVGLRRLGLSIACWAHGFAGATLRIWARSLFSELKQFYMVMYTERVPPAKFRYGECFLEECQGMDPFMRASIGRSGDGGGGDSLMIVGRTEMRVMNLSFISGPVM